MTKALVQQLGSGHAAAPSASPTNHHNSTSDVRIPLPCRREAFVVPFIPGTVPAWSDACFETVEWPNSSQPRSDGDQGWHIIRSPATDSDGWVYGTAFDHLREDRPGGRASKRANDRVRSRLWRRVAWEQPRQQQQAGAQVNSWSELLPDVYLCVLIGGYLQWCQGQACGSQNSQMVTAAVHTSFTQGPMFRSGTYVSVYHSVNGCKCMTHLPSVGHVG